MLSLVELGRNWTFSRTRPKFGKIFVVMALMHCGHSSIAGMLSYAARTLSYAVCMLTQHRGDFCQKGDKIMVTKF